MQLLFEASDWDNAVSWLELLVHKSPLIFKPWQLFTSSFSVLVQQA
jgi:hypothetical protein